VAIGALLVAGAAARSPDQVAPVHTPASAKGLEASLLAPCCWNGTLATHDSPLASDLRGEIEARSAGGEATVAIEADLVTRYGDRIRAMPSGGAFTNAIVIVIDLLIFAIAAMAVSLHRWRQAPAKEEARPAPGEGASSRRDHHDDAIDRELASLDAD
jgi:cytochrome c-type biogenesis protein CcmH